MKSLVSGLYSGVMKCRQKLYDNKIFKSYEFELPVISIGNITMGGAGKTPLTHLLIENLKSKGLRPMVVSRGYKRSTTGIHSVSLGKDAADKYGDEPAMLKTQFPDIEVWVGESKVDTIKQALAYAKPDVILADDAFQHLALKRDLDIVLIDCLEPLENYAVFPKGRGREKISGLKRANYIVFNRVNLAEEEKLREIKNFVSKYSVAPQVELASKLSFYKGNDQITPKVDMDYAAVSGIGRPESFEQLLVEQNIHLDKHHIYPDHYKFEESDIDNWGSFEIICTEKDAIKLKEFPQLSNRLIVACLELSFNKGEKEFFDEIYQSITS